MGTSTSSTGGKAGSPFDPEWLNPDTGSPPGQGGSDADEGDGDGPGDSNTPNTTGEAAPSRRLADARTKMSSYLSGGGQGALRAAAKSMVNRGMGGASRAASTMRNTAQGAGALGQFLASARDSSDQRIVDWVERVRQANLAADDLILELVKEVLPNTGSVDDESLRNAATDALGQLYERNPNIDIFSLTDEQIREVMAITIANEVCNRMDLQLGQTYERLKYDPQQIQLYRNDVREYVQAEVQVVMERCAPAGHDPQQLAREVLQSALEVFAE